MAEPFEYISKARLVYKEGYRNAYLGDVETPIINIWCAGEIA